MGQIALLRMLVTAESAGFATQIVGNLLRICTGGTRAQDAASAERVCGVKSCSWYRDSIGVIWLEVTA